MQIVSIIGQFRWEELNKPVNTEQYFTKTFSSLLDIESQKLNGNKLVLLLFTSPVP